MTSENDRTGGRILVDSLRRQGCDRVFCVPGESYLDVLNALYDAPEINLIVCKHEGAAANMAEADGRLTGRPGICFVTRGPGATHASIGVHTARENSTPMVLFIGQVDRGFIDREAFQEIDYRQMFGGMAKWVAQIEDAARIPEYVFRAFQTATSGRPGPVVLALPEDMLTQVAAVSDTQTFRAARSAPSEDDLAALAAELAQASRPLVILGGGGWTPDACGDMAAFIKSNGLPVAVSFRRQDLFDNECEHYAGHLGLGVNPRLAEHVRSADLLVVVGSRLSEVTTSGYSILEAPRPHQRLVHIHADPEELGHVYQAALMINSGMAEFARAAKALPGVGHAGWKSWVESLRHDFEAFVRPPDAGSEHRGVHLATVVSALSETLSPDAIVCNGAGNYTLWVHRFHKYRQLGTELAPVSGAMGYGLPASVAAKLRHPNRTVVCFAGDGCFLMYPQELSTAVQFGAAIIVLIVNNGMYGTIRMHQERRYPGRVSGTSIENPDFVALARSFGAYAERVSETEGFLDAFARAARAGVPALLELCVDADQITPGVRLTRTERLVGVSSPTGVSVPSKEDSRPS
ncbi:MAG TPA: thiamine pyrophosphate-binding protein [Vicinamibacterales bacterium]